MTNAPDNGKPGKPEEPKIDFFSIKLTVMRKYLVLGLLSVFTLIGGTAMAAGLLVKQQTDYYYNGSLTNTSQFFNANYWDEIDENGDCGTTTKAPCHLPAIDKSALQTQLTSYSSDVDALVAEAGERN